MPRGAPHLPAETAAEWGLIWRAVDDERLIAEAEGLTRRLAAAATAGLALAKVALDAAATNGRDRQLDVERDLQTEAGRTADFAEGVRVFLEKRPARFSGRLPKPIG